MMHASHFSDVLFVIEAVDDRARTQEEHGFEECMGADV